MASARERESCFSPLSSGLFSRACPFSRSSAWKIIMKICSLFRPAMSAYVCNQSRLCSHLARSLVDRWISSDARHGIVLVRTKAVYVYIYLVELYILHSRCYAFLFLIYQRVYYIIVVVVIAFCKQMGLLFLPSLAAVAALRFVIQYTCARSIDSVCVCVESAASFFSFIPRKLGISLMSRIDTCRDHLSR